ncbi:transcriptional antiterminator NusG [Paenibacillus forsythiae]|uniref:Transcriptional antiterminator NusG n=1 Tax=Paenibacillus forsythiae TaxID=365616 RepID=A0ABU3H775_9BACL|nr:antiterminator LoaP [Paenibacillus forsythiae]MDT3425550.1 transcriptional antiterminator NusG [Paenibacillus forsythiae]
MNWYALYVETGNEEQVRQLLLQQFDERSLVCINPKKKVPEKRSGITYHRVRTLFPGYVFIKINMSPEYYHIIKNTPKVYKLVNNGAVYKKPARAASGNSIKEDYSFFSTIPEEEMAPILQVMGTTDVLEYSTITIENSRIHVDSGPLKGMEERIKKVDKHKNRAKVLFEIMGDGKLIDVGVEITNKYDPT